MLFGNVDWLLTGIASTIWLRRIITNPIEYYVDCGVFLRYSGFFQWFSYIFHNSAQVQSAKMCKAVSLCEKIRWKIERKQRKSVICFNLEQCWFAMIMKRSVPRQDHFTLLQVCASFTTLDLVLQFLISQDTDYTKYTWLFIRFKVK